MDARIADLAQLIRTSYNGTVMDFAKLARFFTLDVLSTIAFGGESFGFMAANEDLWDYDKLAVQVCTLSLLPSLPKSCAEYALSVHAHLSGNHASCINAMDTWSANNTRQCSSKTYRPRWLWACIEACARCGKAEVRRKCQSPE